MSRRHGRHAQATSRHKGRHAKPAPPNPAAAVIGTAATSLAIGTAGSVLVLSGTASAAAIPAAAPVSGGTAPITAVTTAATRTLVPQARHPGSRSSYTVIPGDTLSGISARFCGTPADYPALATASGIANPNLIYAGQDITLACHAAAAPARVTAAASGNGDGDDENGAAPATSGSSAAASPSSQAQQSPTAVTAGPAQAPVTASPGAVSPAGLPAFEACVISRESGGNPQAVNASSGAGGLFQFLPATWAALGYAAAYPGGAQTAPVSVQEAAFATLYAQAGTSPWSPYDGC